MMHVTVRNSLVGVGFLAVLAWGAPVRVAGQAKPAAPAAAQHPEGAHTHPEAAAVKNPVKSDAKSIAAGKATYTAKCAACHGATGLGDGKMGANMKTKPANLTDAEWKHGSTDGEIFDVIKDGVKEAGMPKFEGKLTDTQIWEVVNYVRSIGPAAKSH